MAPRIQLSISMLLKNFMLIPIKQNYNFSKEHFMNFTMIYAEKNYC